MGLLVLRDQWELCFVSTKRNRLPEFAFDLCRRHPFASGCLLFADTKGSWTRLTSWFWLAWGLYMPYVAIHTTVLERFIALTRERGNLGYLMALVDSTGYFGYVVVLLVRKLVRFEGNILQFFIVACVIGGSYLAPFDQLVRIALQNQFPHETIAAKQIAGTSA